MKPTYQILPDYSHLFYKSPKVEWINGDGTVEQITIPAILENIKEHSWQAEKIAKHLYDSNIKQFAFNIWHFLKHNFKYEVEVGELLRLPSRSFADRKTGIDCDDFTILACSILKEAKINSAIVVVKQNFESSWSHVYAMVNGYAIDPCPPIKNFNQKAPNITEEMIVKTLGNISLSGLSGTTITENLIKRQNALLDTENFRPEEIRKIRWLINLQDNPFEQRLALKLAPLVEDVSQEGNLIFVDGMDDFTAGQYVGIQAVNLDGELRGLGNANDEVSVIIRDLENQINNSSLEGLGFLKNIGRGIKKGWNGVKNAVSTGARAVGSAAKTFVNNPLHAINKINPATVIIRNAFLLGLRINIFKLSERLKWGYATEAQAKANGLDLTEWKKLQSTIKKVENIHFGIGGKRENLRNAILKGGKGLDGALGEPATASTAAASGLFAKIGAFLKSIDFKKLFNSVKKDAVKSGQAALTAKVTSVVSNSLNPGGNSRTTSSGGNSLFSRISNLRDNVQEQIKKGGVQEALKTTLENSGVKNNAQFDKLREAITSAKPSEKEVKRMFDFFAAWYNSNHKRESLNARNKSFYQFLESGVLLNQSSIEWLKGRVEAGADSSSHSYKARLAYTLNLKGNFKEAVLDAQRLGINDFNPWTGQKSTSVPEGELKRIFEALAAWYKSRFETVKDQARGLSYHEFIASGRMFDSASIEWLRNAISEGRKSSSHSYEIRLAYSLSLKGNYRKALEDAQRLGIKDFNPWSKADQLTVQSNNAISTQQEAPTTGSGGSSALPFAAGITALIVAASALT